MNKYYNRAIIGNKDLTASVSEKGELLRVCFPKIDGRQFVEHFHVGVKINDSNLIYLHNDINNKYKQQYIDKTNILVTNVENNYFNLEVEQTDCVSYDKNVLIRKYTLNNKNKINLDIDFILNSKMISNKSENFGSKIIDNGIIQYNRDYSFSIYSDRALKSHKLNDVEGAIASGTFDDKDYIGMSNEIAISYNIGTLKPNEKKDINIFIKLGTSQSVESELKKYCNLDVEKEIKETTKYWNSYVENHNKINLKKSNDDYIKKILEIYERTILLYPLLINSDTGGIAAALEVDENREKSGAYSYCWTRDAIFITKAFNLLGMQTETEQFYNIFCRKTQSENGMWEQRFYTDTSLAPCWGYQVDETASVIYGIYDYYKCTKNKDFLAKNLKMCENAVKFLFKYVEHTLQIEEEDFVKQELKEKYKKYFEEYKHVSYDLWEMNEGVHLYSLSSIISAFNSMEKIYNVLEDKVEKSRLKLEKRNNAIKKMNKYSALLKDFIKEKLVDTKQMILRRNTKDTQVDISIMGAVYPFEIFDPKEKIVKNTVDKINMTLRTYTGAYLRFEGDNYMGGNNPWVITTLWMALYYIKVGEIEEARACFKYVVDTACRYGFLSEQVNNEDKDFKWVIGLGWSHAMFIIVLNELLNVKNKIA